LKKTVYLYDFDNTVVDCESIVELWKYAYIKRKPIKRLTLSLFIAFFRSNIKKDFKIVKNAMVSILKYFTDNEMREFMVDYILPKYVFKEFEDTFNSHEEDSIKILCSASATNYLKYVKEVYDFDYIIGTDLDLNYKLLFENNKREVKVNNINNLLKREGIEIDFEKSKGYSDSYKDDRFMLDMVMMKYLINSKVVEDGFVNLFWHRKSK